MGSAHITEPPLEGRPKLAIGGAVARTAAGKITLKCVRVSRCDAQRGPVTYQEGERRLNALRNNSWNMGKMVLINNEPGELLQGSLLRGDGPYDLMKCYCCTVARHVHLC